VLVDLDRPLLPLLATCRMSGARILVLTRRRQAAWRQASRQIGPRVDSVPRKRGAAMGISVDGANRFRARARAEDRS